MQNSSTTSEASQHEWNVVEIMIDEGFDQFDASKKETLLASLQTILESQTSEPDFSRHDGNVNLTLKLTNAQLESLRVAFLGGELDDVCVESIESEDFLVRKKTEIET